MSTRPLRRGTRWIVVLAVGVACTGTASAAADQSSRSASGDARALGSAVVSGTFTGKTEGALIALAVVAQPPAAEGQARTISMYVCNGTSVDAWLTGQATGSTAALRSADRRYNAKVRLTPLRATGVLVLPTGRQLGFTAGRAIGAAGLFDVVVATTGSLDGTSTTGATVTGSTRLRVFGTAAATVSVADGSTVALSLPARQLTPGSYRWIVLPDRTVFGANRLGPARGGIGGLQFERATLTGKRRKISAGSAGQKGWGDRQCQALADKWDSLVGKAGDDIAQGNDAAADKKLAAALGMLKTLESKCFVTGIG